MSDQPQPPVPPPPPSRRNALVTALMLLSGIALVVPGVCSLVFAAGFTLSDPKAIFQFNNDPYLGALWIFWLICFGVAAIGIVLLRAASRR